MHSLFTNDSPLLFNCIVASISGAMFFTGWWIMFWVLTEFQEKISGVYVLPGLFASLSFVLINMIPPELIFEQNLSLDTYKTCCGSFCLKFILFFGFMMAFGVLIGTSYILINDYLLDKKELQKAPGFAIFFHNFLLFGATVLFRFRRPHDMY